MLDAACIHDGSAAARRPRSLRVVAEVSQLTSSSRFLFQVMIVQTL